MTTHADKRDYVRDRKDGPTGDHHCHWPGCSRHVSPALWGCYQHWMKLPKALRDKIWATFRAGQEISKTPSREYVEVAREVQDWIAKNFGVQPAVEPRRMGAGVDDAALRAAFEAHTRGQDKFTRRMAIAIADMAGMRPMQLVARLEHLGLLKRGSYAWFQDNGGITPDQVAEVRADLKRAAGIQ